MREDDTFLNEDNISFFFMKVGENESGWVYKLLAKFCLYVDSFYYSSIKTGLSESNSIILTLFSKSPTSRQIC